MGTSRAHMRISRPVDDVWAAITDPAAIVSWFPGVAACTVSDGLRHVRTSTGLEVDEAIITNDGALHRFQYSLLPGAVPVERHLATVDVIEDGTGSLVIYSADVAPDSAAPAMQRTVEAAVSGLKAHIEQVV
jgi:uncharacterized protein YndB with AHSA1/START domain